MRSDLEQATAKSDHLQRRIGLPLPTVCGVTIIAALTLPADTLAEITLIALLVALAIVNAALIGAKGRQPDAPFRVAAAMPCTGKPARIAAFGSAMGDLP